MLKYPVAADWSGADLAFSVLDLAILLIVAFVPSIIYVVWIRNTERFHKEPYARLLRVFVYGATISIVLAIILESLVMELYHMNFARVYELLGDNPNIETILLACVIAPFVEEATKTVGVLRQRRFMAEIEDGIVYGAAAGLGFAATENLLYEGSALVELGTTAFVATAVVRIFSSSLLHASASAVSGLGIARKLRQGRSWLPYYLGAVVMHSIFNLGASLGTLYEDQLGSSADLTGLIMAFMIAFVGISLVRSKIRGLDRGLAR